MITDGNFDYDFSVENAGKPSLWIRGVNQGHPDLRVTGSHQWL